MAQQQKDDVMGKVILGAAGVAIAASGVTAAVVLSDKRHRDRLKRMGEKTARKIGDAAETFQREAADRYQAFQHRISAGETSKRGRKSASSKARHGKKTQRGAVLHRISMGDQMSDKDKTSRGRKKSRS